MTDTMNLWDKDRKTIFRELYRTYLDEGYNQKEAKRMAKEEAEEMVSDQLNFSFSVLDQEYRDED